MVVEPRYQFIDPRCPLCHGARKLVVNQMCRCGRPLRLDAKGQVEGSLYSCGQDACKNILSGKESPTVTHFPMAPGFRGRHRFIGESDAQYDARVAAMLMADTSGVGWE